MANDIYNSFKKAIGDGSVDWDTDVIKVALCTSSYSVNLDTHTNFSSHITNEVTGSTGYSAGGITLSGKGITVDTTNNWAEYTATDVTWGSSTITARYGIVYASVAGDLICYLDFGSDKVSSSGDFKINWHADGVFKLA